MKLQHDTSGIGGHPKGLTTLFFTELWERFSYYGMRAILILYMTAPLAEGGLGFGIAEAASVYGTYTMAVYLLALPGGFAADTLLGTRRAVLLGGVVIALGHCSMAFGTLALFYAGLVMIAVGTGLLKPNISALVGSLYAPNDPRRDAGFSIFFMGINIGAAFAPIVCGYLAQSDGFRDALHAVGLNPRSSWHWGFGAAAVGMVIGLMQFLMFWKHAEPALSTTRHPHQPKHSTSTQTTNTTHSTNTTPLQREQWQRIGAIIVLFVFTVIFGVVSEQAGSSLNLFADRLTHTEILGWRFPSSWFQSVIPLYVIALSPVISGLWLRLGERQPSSPAKFSLSLLFVGLAYLLMIPASLYATHGAVSPLWLLGVFFLQEIGAVLLNPTGLSVVTKLAPAHLAGAMMGVWFLASAVASKIAGFLAGFFDERNTAFLAQYFGALACVMLLASGVLALLIPSIRKLMGGVR
jgi:POT family proton-dependent oligopeptide transporter